MLMASTKRRYHYTTQADSKIYTQDRQMEYKFNMHNKVESKKVSQKTVCLMMFLVIALLFMSWFGMIFFKSMISSVQMEINSVNSQIRGLEQENSMLEAEKINALNIESIKVTAESMGMSLPSSYQVEYVDTADGTANLKITD